MQHLMNKSSLFYLGKDLKDDINEYGENFMEVIKMREKIRIPFLHTSPQLSYRPGLINYLRKACITKKLSHCSLHLAVYLMDTFMDCHNVVPHKILLLANVCLLIAAKFEENIGTIPKISELNALVDNRFTAKEYRDWELMVLDYFCWYILFPTVAHYTYYYIHAVISCEDLAGKDETLRSLFYRIHDCILEYLNHIIDNVHYIQDFKPSQLAATIISASRADCGLSTWNSQLETLTDYRLEDIWNLKLTIQLNRYSQRLPLICYYNTVPCTYMDNYCKVCNVISCGKCNFLKRSNSSQ